MWIPRTLVAWVWTLLIFVACWTPRWMLHEVDESNITYPISNFDKFVHVTLFAGFAVCWMATGKIQARWVLLAGVAATALSEFGQWVPIVGRDATWPDAMADLTGLVGGMVVFALVRAIFPGIVPTRLNSSEKLNNQAEAGVKAPSAETL